MTTENELVLKVWSFTQGWKPELIPAALAVYGAGDAEAVVDGLLTIRGAVERFREARQASGPRPSD